MLYKNFSKTIVTMIISLLLAPSFCLSMRRLTQLLLKNHHRMSNQFETAFETFEEKRVYQNLPTNPSIIIDCDTGNDIDTILSHVYVLMDPIFGKKIKLFTTTLYHPEDKARIIRTISKQLGYYDIPISSGIGVYHGEKKSWLQKYPCWPKKFGIPGTTNKISFFQAKAYEKNFENFERVEISHKTAVNDIISACENYKSNLICIALAPPTNLAQAFNQAPNKVSHINRIVMMGGWFENPEGQIIRLGYNTAIDLKASRTILEQKRIPILIITSQLIKDGKFAIRNKEREVLRLSTHKTLSGKAIYEDLHYYWENKIPAKSELNIADMLTTYLGTHPEAISEIQPVTLHFSEKLIEQNIDMFHPESKNIIQVAEDDKSNIALVKAVHNPEMIRMELILSIFPLFYPNVSKKEIQNLLETENNPAIIAEILNEKI